MTTQQVPDYPPLAPTSEDQLRLQTIGSGLRGVFPCHKPPSGFDDLLRRIDRADR